MAELITATSSEEEVVAFLKKKRVKQYAIDKLDEEGYVEDPEEFLQLTKEDLQELDLKKAVIKVRFCK